MKGATKTARRDRVRGMLVSGINVQLCEAVCVHKVFSCGRIDRGEGREGRKVAPAMWSEIRNIARKRSRRRSRQGRFQGVLLRGVVAHRKNMRGRPRSPSGVLKRRRPRQVRVDSLLRGVVAKGWRAYARLIERQAGQRALNNNCIFA